MDFVAHVAVFKLQCGLLHSEGAHFCIFVYFIWFLLVCIFFYLFFFGRVSDNISDSVGMKKATNVTGW